MSGASMKALVLHAPGDLRFESVPRPELDGADPFAVRVRIGFCGVCGSDIPRIFVKGTYSFPTICGHEFAGVVDACGSGVTAFRPGDRVAVFPLLWCGRCGPCEEGRYVQCEDYDYLGSRSDGAFSEYVIAPEKNLVPVPDAVSLEAAAMTEPAAVALHALRRARLAIGETIAIFGAGPIGLMVALWARAMGAVRIVLVDIDPQKIELARSLGFEDLVDSRSTDPVAAIEALSGGRGAHVTVEGAGVPPTTIAALRAARRGGRVVLLGNPGADVTIPAALISQAMRRELDIVGTWNSDYSASGNDDDWRTVLASMASGALPLEPLITHRVALGDSLAILEGIRDRSLFSAKVLLHP